MVPSLGHSDDDPSKEFKGPINRFAILIDSARREIGAAILGVEQWQPRVRIQRID
jgi:hypothetical protein